MSGYGQFCAVARALEVLGERWTLLILRELLLGAKTFTDICRGLPRIPRATLSTRLRGLCAAGVVEHADGDYRLTETGLALAPVLRELARWAVTTDAAALTDGDLDTAALTWDMQRRVEVGALPDRTVVLAIDFTDRAATDRHFWLHLARTGVNLCRQDTGAPVDVWSPRRLPRQPGGGSATCRGHSSCASQAYEHTATGSCNGRCTAGFPDTCSRRKHWAEAIPYEARSCQPTWDNYPCE